jgi:hypothetical protein
LCQSKSRLMSLSIAFSSFSSQLDDQLLCIELFTNFFV